MHRHIKGGGSPFLNPSGMHLKPAAAPDEPVHVEVYKRLQTVADSGSSASGLFGSMPPPDTIPAHRNGGQIPNQLCCMKFSIASAANCVKSTSAVPCRLCEVPCKLSCTCLSEPLMVRA